MPELLSNFIGGRWTAATAAGHVDVYNPASGEVIARTPLSGAQDVDRAVRAAAEAFPAWSETPPVVRARTKLGIAIAANRPMMATTIMISTSVKANCSFLVIFILTFRFVLWP